MKTPIERVGFVLTVAGVLALIVWCIGQLPTIDQRPRSKQWHEMVNRLHAEQKANPKPLPKTSEDDSFLKMLADSHDPQTREIAKSLKPKPTTDQSSDDADTFSFYQGLSDSQIADPWGEWTPDSYLRAWGDNIASAPKYSRAFRVSLWVTASGLFFWLIYVRTFARLFSWIKTG